MLTHDETAVMRRARLRYAEVDELTVARQRRGRGFSFLDADGNVIGHGPLRRHYLTLAIPPAWQGVRLAPDTRFHLQAVGVDDAGRTQYRYHDAWEKVREAVKARRLKRFGKALPNIRTRVQTDLKRRTMDPQVVSAAALRLVDLALLRPGYECYARRDGGRGVATLLNRDVSIAAGVIKLSYRGKGGTQIRKTVRDRRLVRVLGRLKRTGGPRLFMLPEEDADGDFSAVTLNQYLKDAAECDVSAKDFRTFEASAQALELLAREPAPESEYKFRRTMAAVARDVSGRLGNTPQVARTSYIHPAIVEAFRTGRLDERLLKGRLRAGLSRSETALMRFLEDTRGAAKY